MKLRTASLLLAVSCFAVSGFAGTTATRFPTGQRTGHRAPPPNHIGGLDPVVYSQPTDLNGAFSSQNDTTGGNGNFATAYDNFTLNTGNPNGTSITDVHWTGSYFNPPTQGNITGFTVNFYADNGGIPGTLLQSTFVNGSANETSIGIDNFGDPTFTYSITQPDLNLTDGVQYWLSIVPDLGFPPQWGWETSATGDGQSYQCFFGTCGFNPSDLAFDLTGVPEGGGGGVPEPSSLILLGTGLLGAAGVLRRKLNF